jgi:hypothetical protein
LTAAAGCLDRCEAARKIVESQGAIIADRVGGPKEHPASRQERDEKLLFSKLVRELGLDPNPPGESRPPILPNRYEHR